MTLLGARMKIQPNGESHTIVLSGEPAGSGLYFRVRTCDEAGNCSYPKTLRSACP